MMNLTQKFIEARTRLQPYPPMAETTPLIPEIADPDWIKNAYQIQEELGKIDKMIKQIDGKQVQKTKAQFQDALNQEILVMRSQLVKQMQDTSKRIQRYEHQQIDPSDLEARIFLKYSAKSMKQLMNTLTNNFRVLQSKFIDGLQKPTQQLDVATMDKEARGYYEQAQQQLQEDTQDVTQICKDVNSIVQMVGQLAAQVYECGTIIDRIDQNLMEAEDFIDKGNNNLEKAKKTQDSVSKLRSFTYALILANYILAAVMMGLKLVKYMHPSKPTPPNPNPTP
ncbi:Syntaxin_16 [Hexamita inflata]|uniref:Syntaxin 16 n=2 Tax=Hexamita inflata TaxID=28002 RepID=A0AA86U9R8_9EUKA|nr:Syntaxin 16 [Hexamita inflata]CAI9958883.1 Syntaxin 16 [Hexamita inflata]